MSTKTSHLTGCFAGIIILLSLLAFWWPSARVSALSGGDFEAGHIIDDAVFTNDQALSVNDIQNFLNDQVPDCDTYGSQLISYYYNSSTGEVNNGGTYTTTTRALYGQRYDTWKTQQTGSTVSIANAPYVCLKNYVENPSTGVNNLQNPSASVPGGESAAQIIYNAAQQFQINPEVLLTTLQKEQGLVTDDWPWTSEYTEAMGYNCTDSAPCSGFAGFYQQVNAAAQQYRYYLQYPNDFNYVVGSNVIDYSVPPPNGSCTSTENVTIQNQATAALYDYTPYAPDSNVLANTNSTGSSSGPGPSINDPCAAYGNRNFWWYFNTWFGSSYFTINIEYDVGDDAVDSSGSVAIIPIRLSSPPLSTVVLNYTVSNTADAKILGNSSLTFSPSNWNTDQYITVQGLDSSNDSGDFDLEVAYINSPDGTYSQSVTPYLNVLPMLWSNLNDMAIYRLYNSTSGTHAYAVSPTDVSNLEANGYSMEATLGYQCPGSIDTPLVVENSLGLVRSYFSSDIFNKQIATPMIMFSNTNGSIYVTLLKNPGGTDSVLSISPAEVSNLEQNGYTDITSFMLCASGAEAVYRMYDPVNESHFYTVNNAEVANMLSFGFNYEGVAFNINETDTIPVYRLFDPSNGSHFYTASQSESNAAQSIGYKFEGIAFNVGSSSGPVYRLYSPTTQIHFLTSSTAESSQAQSAGYKYEGIAFYLN